jgi:hypothetical protein
MEAANRGAHEAGGKTIGLNIRLPFEQHPNPWITPELNFEFHYFFMRKLWFAYLAKALVVFPGRLWHHRRNVRGADAGPDPQTGQEHHRRHLRLRILEEGLQLRVAVDTGAISPGDVDLFRFADTPEEAFELLKEGLVTHHLDPEARREVKPPTPEELLGPEFARTL